MHIRILDDSTLRHPDHIVQYAWWRIASALPSSPSIQSADVSLSEEDGDTICRVSLRSSDGRSTVVSHRDAELTRAIDAASDALMQLLAAPMPVSHGRVRRHA